MCSSDLGRQQALRGIPTREVVTRVAHQERQLLVAPLIFKFDRRGEFTQQRRYRLEVNVIKDERLFRLGDIQHVVHRMAALLQGDSAVGGVRWLIVRVYCSVSGL